MIFELFLTPIITGVVCFLLKNKRVIEIVNVLGASVMLALMVIIAYQVFVFGPILDGDWYVDDLSAYFLLIIVFIGFLVSLYSIDYIEHDYSTGEISLPKLRSYYPFLHVFIGSMILICISNNLGIVWVAIEATTLTSAFLVGFYNKKASVEAAWKYIIICSAGIVIALLGTIFLYLTSVTALGNVPDALDWTTIVANADKLDPSFMKITFVLIFIGYGTKFGLVPMHTWLPDAHSQAPTPISALLSGVLLNCALYGILRYHIIAVRVLGVGFSNNLFLIFGLLSLVTAMFFILIVKDYKRLLAYHSIEHMGIISIGFGIGGPIAIFGAIFHVMNHSFTKSLLFFGSGNILQKYGTRDIEQVKGVGKVMPATAIFFMMGMFALTGCPPFSIFVSEITILNGMITQQNYIIAGVFIATIVAIFAGFVNHAGDMIFGEPLIMVRSSEEGTPALLTQGEEPPKEVKGTPVARGELSRTSLVIMAVLIFAIIYLGVAIPAWFNGMIAGIARLF